MSKVTNCTDCPLLTMNNRKLPHKCQHPKSNHTHEERLRRTTEAMFLNCPLKKEPLLIQLKVF